MMESEDLVGIKEAAEILGWSQNKVSVYYGRGVMPETFTKLAATPVWMRQDIERLARQEGTQVDPVQDTRPDILVGYPIPEEHIRAILWAHFESARLGILRPRNYGDPLPWTIEEKPPGHAQALPGMRFPVTYNEVWPKFLEIMLGRYDLQELLVEPDKMWDVANDVFNQVYFAWSRQKKEEEELDNEVATHDKPEPMPVSEAMYILRLPTHLNGEPDYYFLEGRREERLNQAKTDEERDKIKEAYRVLKQAQIDDRRNPRR